MKRAKRFYSKQDLFYRLIIDSVLCFYIYEIAVPEKITELEEVLKNELFGYFSTDAYRKIFKIFKCIKITKLHYILPLDQFSTGIIIDPIVLFIFTQKNIFPNVRLGKLERLICENPNVFVDYLRKNQFYSLKYLSTTINRNVAYNIQSGEKLLSEIKFLKLTCIENCVVPLYKFNNLKSFVWRNQNKYKCTFVVKRNMKVMSKLEHLDMHYDEKYKENIFHYLNELKTLRISSGYPELIKFFTMKNILKKLVKLEIWALGFGFDTIEFENIFPNLKILKICFRFRQVHVYYKNRNFPILELLHMSGVNLHIERDEYINIKTLKLEHGIIDYKFLDMIYKIEEMFILLSLEFLEYLRTNNIVFETVKDLKLTYYISRTGITYLQIIDMLIKSFPNLKRLSLSFKISPDAVFEDLFTYNVDAKIYFRKLEFINKDVKYHSFLEFQ